ncbi:MAG: hypothetical protein AVDCRST_MAG73-939, partial [uncultured Thermomicrobiales bacterium]
GPTGRSGPWHVAPLSRPPVPRRAARPAGHRRAVRPARRRGRRADGRRGPRD